MKKSLLFLLVTAMAVGIATGFNRGAVRADDSPDNVAQEIPASLMRQKLDHAQKLLSALAIGDFERMVSNAEELQRISLEARWSQPHSPAYAEYGDDFRSSLERLVNAAEQQNIDGAALNYVQVVLTCVQCHKVVREGEQVAHEAGLGAWGLLDNVPDAAAD